MADSVTKSDLEAENARLRDVLERNGINPDAELDPTIGVVGNLADVQRLGALAAKPGVKTNIDDAVVVPARVDADTGEQTPAQTASGKDPGDIG